MSPSCFPSSASESWCAVFSSILKVVNSGRPWRGSGFLLWLCHEWKRFCPACMSSLVPLVREVTSLPGKSWGLCWG